MHMIFIWTPKIVRKVDMDLVTILSSSHVSYVRRGGLLTRSNHLRPTPRWDPMYMSTALLSTLPPSTTPSFHHIHNSSTKPLFHHLHNSSISHSQELRELTAPRDQQREWARGEDCSGDGGDGCNGGRNGHDNGATANKRHTFFSFWCDCGSSRSSHCAAKSVSTWTSSCLQSSKGRAGIPHGQAIGERCASPPGCRPGWSVLYSLNSFLLL